MATSIAYNVGHDARHALPRAATSGELNDRHRWAPTPLERRKNTTADVCQQLSGERGPGIAARDEDGEDARHLGLCQRYGFVWISFFCITATPIFPVEAN